MQKELEKKKEIKKKVDLEIQNELEKYLSYEFKNKDLLTNAITHSSFSNELGGENYERLEFLGDSILGFITSEYLYETFKELSEGELTRLRATLVCEKTLMKFSKLLDVGRFLKLSFGEQRGGGRDRASILADVFEAIIAAIYLDSNLDSAREFILRFIKLQLADPQINSSKDYKTEIQEFVQLKDSYLVYELVDTRGPDHDKFFIIELKIDGNFVSRGSGKSKKEAEQNAAKIACELLI